MSAGGSERTIHSLPRLNMLPVKLQLLFLSDSSVLSAHGLLLWLRFLLCLGLSKHIGQLCYFAVLCLRCDGESIDSSVVAEAIRLQRK